MKALIRPLLEIDRTEIEAWLRERDIAWHEDETNQDPAYARNRLRHDILPLLRKEFNPQLDSRFGEPRHPRSATKKLTGNPNWPSANPQSPTPAPR